MQDPEPASSDSESVIGIRAHLSKSPGIGGTIKGEPEDFIVEEITPEGILLETGKSHAFGSTPGDYTHFTLEKRNWDTMRAAKEVAKRLGSSHTRIKYAGTKDRRSISTQRMSVWKTPAEKLAKVNIKDITLRDFSSSPEPVNLGNLNGNRFTINIAGVSKDAEAQVKKIIGELDGKAPNFYGTQRFGSRLNNHKVGRHLLRGDFRGAVMEYLCGTGNEPEDATAARERLRDSSDFKAALKEFPDYLGFEKSVLNRLVREPTDFAGAFRELPKKLRLMFVHSVQGYVFNLALSEYLEKGDLAGIPEKLSLVGYATTPDKVTEGVLAKEGLTLQEFKIPSMPEMSLEGEFRDALVPFQGFEILGLTEIPRDKGCDSKEGFNGGDSNIKMRFSLPPGAYATVLLGELIR